METQPEAFWEWAECHLRERDLTWYAVERKAGLANAAISKRARDRLPPTATTCRALAHVFDLPPQRVFREAGILPPRVIGGENRERKGELLDYYEALDERGRDTALAMLRTLYEQRGPYAAELRPDKDKED